jgi:hypothetical protein
MQNGIHDNDLNRLRELVETSVRDSVLCSEQEITNLIF